MSASRPAQRAAAALGFEAEAELAAAWGAGLSGPLRLVDGRAVRVVFPGVPGDGTGPDFRGAIVDIEGDLVRGDIELHLRHSGWFAHGHDRDAAYRGVALHVVAANDLGLSATAHASGRRIPLLVLSRPPLGADRLPGFVPPCAFARAAGVDVAGRLAAMGRRRLRMKANRAALLAAGRDRGEVLFSLTAEALFGPANRAAGRAVAQAGLARLLELGEGQGGRAALRLALAGELRRLMAGAALGGGRARPAAAPGRRVDALAALAVRWWPPGCRGGWPAELVPGVGWRAAAAEGVGRAAAIEVMVNAVVPAALGTGVWTEAEAMAVWAALPSPGTYGRLGPLERWLGGSADRPFDSAARLQGGLLLQADYCAKGACGRCPLSELG